MTREETETIKETIKLLKNRFGATIQEILEAYYEAPTIPATAFATNLTPLETITLHLTQRKHTPQEIATLIQRPTTTITNALENAKKKGTTIPNTETPYHIPTTAFNNTLSPAETIIHHLSAEYKLNNKTIAELLRRDPRNTHQILSRAKKKIGGENT